MEIERFKLNRSFFLQKFLLFLYMKKLYWNEQQDEIIKNINKSEGVKKDIYIKQIYGPL